MVALSLLVHGLAQGLRVSLDGDRLVVKGPRRLASLAERLLQERTAVVALLRDQPGLAGLDAFTPRVVELFDGVLVEGGSTAVPVSTDRSSRRCYNCGSRRWWRLQRGSDGNPCPWVCGACTPPGRGVGPIEWWPANE